MNWLDRLFGRHEPAPEVVAAREKRDQDFEELREAVAEAKGSTLEADRAVNGVIRDYIEAEKGIRGRP